MSTTPPNYINVHITIDAKAIIAAGEPTSLNPGAPVGIGHQYQYMVVTHSNVISGEGGADLNFSASVGDVVRFIATSSSGNFEEGVLVYGINAFNGTPTVITGLHGNSYKREDVCPSGPVVVPASTCDQTFSFYLGNVAQTGTEQYIVNFGLYTRNTETLEPELYGYYSWDPTVTVAQ